MLLDPDPAMLWQVLYPQSQESYQFNRYGQHVSTRSLATDSFLYNFTYNVNSYYGKLMRVNDSAGNTLSLRRDYKLQAKARISIQVTGQGKDIYLYPNTNYRPR